MFSIDDRPRAFSELAGLSKMVEEVSRHFKATPCTFPQRIILEGESGTGKTSTAYLLASLLSAPESLKFDQDGIPFPDPEHPATRHVFNETFGRDVHFFDASSLGKTDLHELEDLLGTASMYDDSKVIIIDEAQELTKAGKGAVYSLLERVRSNTYLILCTMNIQAFDKAIRSRAQVYSFKRVKPKEITDYLFSLLEKHNLDKVPDIFLEEGLFAVAEASDGSVRQAVQLFERCLNAELWSEKEILEHLGVLASETAVGELTAGLLECNPAVLDQALKSDPKELVFRLSSSLSRAIVWQLTGEAKTDWDANLYKRMAQTGRVRPLLEVVNRLCALPYLREAIVHSELALYMLDNRGDKKMIKTITPLENRSESMAPQAADVRVVSEGVPHRATRRAVVQG